jgi:hypothetical protein
MNVFAERSLATIAAEAPSAGVTSTLNLHDLQRDLIHKRREDKLNAKSLNSIGQTSTVLTTKDYFTYR